MEETPKDTTSGRVPRTSRTPRQHGPGIRALRIKDGWSPAEFAEAAGIHHAALSAIERGTACPDEATLSRIARQLRVPAAAVTLSPDDGTASGRVTRGGRPPRQHGPLIQALRMKDGLSQTGFAEKAGIHQTTLSAIESELSNAGWEVLNRIARLLRVPTAAVMRDPGTDAGLEPEYAEAS